MSTYNKTIVRCEVDVTSRETFQDVNTGRMPQIWASAGAEFQLAFFKGKGNLLDVTNFQMVTVAIVASNLTGLPFASKVAPLIDTGLTEAEWLAEISTRTGFEAACQARISFTGAELALAPGTYALVISGSTMDDPTDPDCFGITTIQIVADGFPAVSGPVQAGNVIPAAATYANDGTYQVTGLTANVTYYFTSNANDATLTSGTQTLTQSGIFVAQGTTVNLSGTPNLPVTAGIRINPLLDGNTADARYFQKSAPAAFADGVPLILALDGLTYKIRPVKTANGLVTIKPDQTGSAAAGFTKLALFCADDGLYHDLTLVKDSGVVTYTINPAGYSL